MPAANRNDPFGSFSFMVEIGVVKGSFSGVFRLHAEIEPVAREATISQSARFPASKSSATFRSSAG